MKDEVDLFKKLKQNILKIDPVSFCETYLTLEGQPFRINGNGFKPFADIYRYIGVKALETNSKPVVLLKSRQTGGTTMASALEMYFMGSGFFGTQNRPPIRIIHAFPTLDMAAVYTKTKLNLMINNSITEEVGIKEKSKSYMQKLIDTSSHTSESLHFKQFINGNHMFIDSTGLDGDRLRGRTVDVIFFDEVQDIRSTAISNVTKMLNQAKYGRPGKGVQIYFGTPKKKGSDFYKYWNVSNQQYYHLGCEKCGKDFPLYTPGTDKWEHIWIEGFIVECTHCQHRQDKREAAERGKWVSYVEDPDATEYIGFHINQLYMPMIRKEDVISEKPNIHPTNSERAYFNEVLGEFYQGDSSPITLEELHDNCGEPERKIRSFISPGQEDMVIMGIDYGRKSDLEQQANPEKFKNYGKSFTAAVIISVKGSKLLHVEYCEKFKENSVAYKQERIEQLTKRYDVKLIVGDLGYSNDFSELLYHSYGDKYLTTQAGGKVSNANHIKYDADSCPKNLFFEREFYITEIMELLKKGNVKFPFKGSSYESMTWLLNHITNFDIKPITRQGEPNISYTKSGPTDGAMALLNAYLGYKYLITKGFSTNAFNVHSKEDKIPIILGNISKRI